MGDVIHLHSPIDINSDLGRAFVVDATRAGEGLLTDKELQEKYELSPVDWQNITKDKALGRAIRDERDRRVRTGIAARESAARYFVKGPSILDQIATDTNSNPRHKIDAIRELRATAAGSGGDGPAQGEKISIVINLGSDQIERHEFDHPEQTAAGIGSGGQARWQRMGMTGQAFSPDTLRLRKKSRRPRRPLWQPPCRH